MLQRKFNTEKIYRSFYYTEKSLLPKTNKQQQQKNFGGLIGFKKCFNQFISYMRSLSKEMDTKVLNRLQCYFVKYVLSVRNIEKRLKKHLYKKI